MTECFHDTTTPIPSYFFNKPYNIIAQEVSGNKISSENELTEYFIQFRGNDLIDSFETLKLDIDINENPILGNVLIKEKDNFRILIRDAVANSIVTVLYDMDDALIITNELKRIRNKIDIDIDFPINITLSELNPSDHEGEVVTFEADVGYWNKKKDIAHKAYYKCTECGGMDPRPFKKKATYTCHIDNRPCEYSHPFETEFTRRLMLREITNDYSGDKQPATISADIYGKDVMDVKQSDKIVVTGLFKSIKLKEEQGKNNVEFMPTIQVISIKNKKNVVLMPSDELKEKFKNLEKEGKLVDAIIDGFAYNVYMKRNEKKAVIGSIIGSQWMGKDCPPMIFVMFVGDPSTYKSTIMKSITDVHDNSVIIDSNNISKAGMIAIAIKNEVGEWSIKAGIIPTYNNGVVFFDEFGDMESKDMYEELKTCMVNGFATKDVAGENFRGKTETGILMSMNPIDGSWDYDKNLFENMIKIPTPVLSRIDLMFKFELSFCEENADAIEEHIDASDQFGKPEGIFTNEEVQMFLNYVKTRTPEITSEALKRKSEFFKGLKNEHEDLIIDQRTKNAIMKYAVVFAKWHMNDKVLPEHVNEALRLYEYSLETFGMHLEQGEIISENSFKPTKSGKRTALRKAYDLLKDKNGFVFRADLANKASAYKCFKDLEEVNALLYDLDYASAISTQNKMIKIDWNA